MPPRTRYPVDVVLSLSTGRLVTREESDGSNGFQHVHELITHMLGYDVWTHQLPRVAPQCEEEIRKQFPELSMVNTGPLDLLVERHQGNQEKIRESINQWVAREIDRCGLQADYEVAPIANPPEPRNPLAELSEMVPPEKIIPVITPEK